MDNNKSTNKGIGFTGLLTLAFIVLKLCGVVTWSWWWVLSPIWISIGVCAMLLIIMFFIVTAYDWGREAAQCKSRIRHLFAQPLSSCC